MRPLVLVSAVLLLVVAVAALIACNPSASTKTIPPTPQHLYVAGTSIAQYTLPLTSTSTPNFNLAASNITGLALDPSGNLVTLDSNTSTVSVYDAPLSASSTAAVSFNCPTVGVSTAVDSAGDVFVSGWGATDVGWGDIFVFDPPLSNSSTVATTLNLNPYLPAGLLIAGLVFDSNGNLIVASNFGTSTGGVSLSVLAPPYTGAPSVITPPISGNGYSGLAINGTQLFAVGNAAVDVYSLPLTSSSAPTFSITSPSPSPQEIAFDKSGNMYIGTTYGKLQVFAPPFSSTSTPTVTLTLSTGGLEWDILGLAITQ